MDEIKYLLPNQIGISECNLRRQNLDERHVNEIINSLKRGQTPDSIKVRWETDRYKCIDGQHRLEAYKRYLPNIPIQVIVKNMTDEEARQHSFDSNLGKNWKTIDLMNLFFEEYQWGYDIKSIAVKYGKSEPKVNEFIRLRAFIHPEILPLIDEPGTYHIKLSAGKLLAGFPADIQIDLVNAYFNDRSINMTFTNYLDQYKKQNPTLFKTKKIRLYFNKVPRTEPVISTPETPDLFIMEMLNTDQLTLEIVEMLNRIKDWSDQNYARDLVITEFNKIFN